MDYVPCGRVMAADDQGEHYTAMVVSTLFHLHGKCCMYDYKIWIHVNGKRARARVHMHNAFTTMLSKMERICCM